MHLTGEKSVNAPSPPSRGAWIEIEALNNNTVVMTVAPLAGGVD